MREQLLKTKSIVIVAFLLFIVSACSPGQQGNESNDQANENNENNNDESVVLSAAVFGDREQISNWMEEIGREVGVELDIQVLPDGEQSEQLYKTKAATNSLPDIVYYHAGTKFRADLVPQSNLVDLSNEEWVSKLDENVLASYSDDGKVYAAPMGGATGFGMIYNYDLFEELGLEIPNTHDELKGALETIKNETDVMPLYISGGDPWSLQIPGLMGFATDFARNPELVNEISTNKSTFMEAENFIDTYQLLEELKDQDLINSDYLSATYANAQTQIAEKGAAMYPNAASLSGTLASAYSDEELSHLGYFMYPSDGESVYSANPTYALGVSEDSNHKEKAIEFINYFMSEEGQQIFLDKAEGFTLPALPDMELDTSELNEFEQRILEAYEGQESVPSFESELSINIGDFGPLVQEMLTGGRTPEGIADEIQKTLERNAKAEDVPEFIE